MATSHNSIGDSDAEASACEQYVSLIQSGKQLLNCIKGGNLSIDVHPWIVAAIDHTVPVMPMETPEYKELGDIREVYYGRRVLIPGRVLSDVVTVLQNLSIAYRCLLFGIAGQAKDIPPDRVADIAFGLLKDTKDCVRSKLVTELAGKEDGRTKRTALLHSYGRIYCLAESIVKLNGLCDYLAIAGSTRAILELFIDMNLLSTSKDDMDADRYFSFTDVSRLKTAKNIVRLRAEYGLVSRDERRPVDEFLAEEPQKEEMLRSTRERLWGKTKKGSLVQPCHWTNLPMVDRVKKIGSKTVMNTYLETYYYCNWSVHSGYSGFPGPTAEQVHLYNWHLYSLSNSMLVESSLLVNKEIGVLQNKTLKKELEKISELHSRHFWGELVKAGKEKKS